MEARITMKDLLIGLTIGVLVVAIVASFYEPFSDEQLQQMHLEQTRDMPQDR